MRAGAYAAFLWELCSVFMGLEGWWSVFMGEKCAKECGKWGVWVNRNGYRGKMGAKIEAK